MMRFAAFDTVSASGPIATFPLHIEQRSSRLPAAALLVLLSALIVLATIPAALVLALAAGALWEHPLAGIQSAVGLAIWFALFMVPAADMVRRLHRSRTVELDAAFVQVVDRNLLSSHCWSEPVHAFEGVAHHIRTSMSGTRHELILAHPDRSRCVLIAAADRISQTEIETACRTLGLCEIPARELYRARAKVTANGPAIAGTGLATATT